MTNVMQCIASNHLGICVQRINLLTNIKILTNEEMQIIIVLIAISIGLALIFLLSFLWATKTGQYEDTYGPAVRILFEDEVENKQKTDNNKKQAECK